MGNGIAPTKSASEGWLCKDDFIASVILGEGGFSRVSACLHVPTKKWMALKETSIKLACSHKDGLSNLSSEVKILSILSKEEHPFVVNMNFAFHDLTTCYIALDLHGGGDLRYHMRRNKGFSEKVVAFYTICLSSALHHIHKLGILHRDVKPENVILNEMGYPHLTDFGISSYGDPAKELLCYSSSGTRQYLAPEVFTKSHRHGVEADFWSLGVMLYELIYGHRPFKTHCKHSMVKFHEELHRNNFFLSSTISGDWSTISSDEHEEYDGKIDEHTLYVESAIDTNKVMKKKLDIMEKEAKLDMQIESESAFNSKGYLMPKIYSSGICFATRRSVPKRYRADVPPYTSREKPVSLACMSVIDGLLDIRLWARLGAGQNFSKLQEHVWFEECLLAWDYVLDKKVYPMYVPNTQQISRDLQSKRRNISPSYQTELKSALTLTSTQENELENIHFVAEKYEQPQKSKVAETALCEVSSKKKQGAEDKCDYRNYRRLSLRHKLKHRFKSASTIKLREILPDPASLL